MPRRAVSKHACMYAYQAVSRIEAYTLPVNKGTIPSTARVNYKRCRVHEHALVALAQRLHSEGGMHARRCYCVPFC